jgi:CheY-like chemotaxis protein
MDISLPVLDGWEAAAIKANDKLSHIPVIGLSAPCDERRPAKSPAAGCAIT